MTTLFIVFEDMGYDGHFISSDDSKIFTKREFAEAYAKEKNIDEKEQVRARMNEKTKEEILKDFKYEKVNTMDEYLEEYPGNPWQVEELELVK